MLDRALSIVDALTAADTDLSLTEIVHRTGFPTTTTHRILRRLEAWGAVERVDDRFRLGTKMFEIGERVPRERALRDSALPFLHDLAAVTHHPAQVAVLAGHEVLCVDAISPRGAVPPIKPGYRMPTHCSALGKVLLAYAAPGVIDEVLSGSLARRTRYTITDPRVLDQQLAAVRETLGAIDCEESALGWSSAAAPIIGRPLWSVVGAIGISIPAVADPERFVHTVGLAAHGLSRLLTGATLVYPPTWP